MKDTFFDPDNTIQLAGDILGGFAARVGEVMDFIEDFLS